MKPRQTQLSKAAATALIKPTKTKLNFFKYPSLEPNRINSYEINQLLKNSDLDKVSHRLRNQARSISTSVSLTSGFFEMLCKVCVILSVAMLFFPVTCLLQTVKFKSIFIFSWIIYDKFITF